MQGARDAGPVVVAERADAFHHKGNGLGSDRLRGQIGSLGNIARLGRTAQVEDDFQQLVQGALPQYGLTQRRWKNVQQPLDIINGFQAHNMVRNVTAGRGTGRQLPLGVFATLSGV